MTEEKERQLERLFRDHYERMFRTIASTKKKGYVLK